jgi:hypothetical protein
MPGLCAQVGHCRPRKLSIRSPRSFFPFSGCGWQWILSLLLLSGIGSCFGGWVQTCVIVVSRRSISSAGVWIGELKDCKSGRCTSTAAAACLSSWPRIHVELLFRGDECSRGAELHHSITPGISKSRLQLLRQQPHNRDTTPTTRQIHSNSLLAYLTRSNCTIQDAPTTTPAAIAGHGTRWRRPTTSSAAARRITFQEAGTRSRKGRRQPPRKPSNYSTLRGVARLTRPRELYSAA